MRRHKKTNCEAVYQSGVHAWAVPKIGNGSLVCVECKRSIGLGELATTAYLLKSIVRGYLTRHGEAKAAKLKDGIAQATRHLFSRGAVVVGRDGEVEGGGGGDRRSEDFNVTNGNVETGAERKRLHHARQRIEPVGPRTKCLASCTC